MAQRNPAITNYTVSISVPRMPLPLLRYQRIADGMANPTILNGAMPTTVDGDSPPPAATIWGERIDAVVRVRGVEEVPQRLLHPSNPSKLCTSATFMMWTFGSMTRSWSRGVVGPLAALECSNANIINAIF